MPKRVIDFDAMWGSDKLAACEEWAQPEYAWLYGLADASGSFEMSNPRVMWGRVAAIRQSFTLEHLLRVFDEFAAHGLLFTWSANGKRYGHWTGSDVPGRLPAPSWRVRLERLAPPVPRAELAAYVARFGSRHGGRGDTDEMIADRVAKPAAGGDQNAETETEAEATDPEAQRQRDFCGANRSTAPLDDGGRESRLDAGAMVVPFAGAREEMETRMRASPGNDSSARPSGQGRGNDLNARLEAAQAQDLDWNLNVKWEGKETQMCECVAPETLLEIYREERGALPAPPELTAERARKCAARLGAGLHPEVFRSAVRKAALTPFLLGQGASGWRANFDWFIASENNAQKVLDGHYARGRPPRDRYAGGISREAPQPGLAELRVGRGPIPEEHGARVNETALKRIRAREAERLRKIGAAQGAGPVAPERSAAPDAQVRADGTHGGTR